MRNYAFILDFTKKTLTNERTCYIMQSQVVINNMKIYRGYKFRMYPNNEQEKLINKTIGSCRFIYNHFLDKKVSNAYNGIKLIPELTKEKTFLKEVDSCALRNSIFNLEDAYKRYYKNLGGYPKFKIKGINNSYKTNNIKSTYKGKKYNSIKLDLINKIITLPKLKEVSIRGYRNKNKLNGEVKSAVIRKEGSKYYVSVLIEEDIIIKPFTPNTIVGIDLGIKDFLVTSHNEKIKNTIKINEKRLRGLQRGLARCKIGSKNRYKLKLKIQRLFMKIKNARKFLLHTITNKIISENDIIAVENLDVESMKQNHYIAKYLTENPIAEIIRVLNYKATWNNKKLIEINRYYPSSQLCSVCNYQNKKIKDLSIRTWQCPQCGYVHDRDVNAAINVMCEGLKIYIKTYERELMTP